MIEFSDYEITWLLRHLNIKPDSLHIMAVQMWLKAMNERRYAANL